MARLLELSDARHRLRIAPHAGAAIATFDARTAAGPVPILRGTETPDAGAFDLGCNLLVPFSNRISGGGFRFAGTFHPVAPNLAGEPYPIHGDGFQAAWTVRDASGSAAHLTHLGEIGPYRYAASVTYSLAGGGLETSLTMENRGPALPFGGGFHPWFPRTPATRLQFAAQGVWTETADHLPVAHLPLAERPEWDFGTASPLPEGFINNAFTGWDGTARILQPDHGIALSLSATPPCTVAQVFSPEPGCGFFCFEPVSHTVDAHNQPGQPGLVVLEPGQSLTLSMTLHWEALP